MKTVNNLPRLPLKSILDLTYRCNNKCRHCWLRIPPDAAKKKEELSFEEIKRIAEEAKQMGCREWSISGGEPMLRPDFSVIFDYLTENSASYSVNTSGTLITPKIAKLMARKGVKMVALYGGCVDAYGKFQPCMALRYTDCVYDLKKGSLKDALINFFPAMRKMRATDPEYLAKCARCFLKGLCEQCPAKSWMEHGTLDTPVDYLCGIAHSQARFLGLISGEEKAWQIEDWKTRIRNFVEN